MGSFNFWLILLAPLTTSALPVKPGDYSKQEVSGQFWHISDLHLDFSYHLTDDHTKVCLSSKGANASSPGIFGDFMCDSPYGLILSSIQYIKASAQKVDFMIWTGDSPPHVPVNELSTKIVIDVIGNMTSTIRSLLPDMLVFPALGNHDYWPQARFTQQILICPRNADGNHIVLHSDTHLNAVQEAFRVYGILQDQLPVSGSEIYTAVAQFWKPWLSEEALCTFRKGGYYSQIYKSNVTSHPLRIISLNTNLYYSPNQETVNITDPADQFEWLEETLKHSRQNNEKVYIIAHVPIGFLPFTIFTTAMRDTFNEKLIKIFRTYSDIIAGQFYGHTHRDSIMVVLDERDKPIGSAFVAPAVTPIKSSSESDSNNPGLRLYQYDTNSYSLKDLWHYYLNLTDANIRKEALWKLEYIMTKEYNIKDLQPESLQELIIRFEKPKSVEFQHYYKNYVVNFDTPDGCEDLCKKRQLCAIQHVDAMSYIKCIQRHN